MRIRVQTRVSLCAGVSYRERRRPISPRGATLITAIVMISAATDRIPETAQTIAEIDGVSEVYSVAGGVDLVAMVRVREFDDIAETVSNRINKVDGVIDTDTHVAFRAFSKHDLEATFSIGLE